MSRLERCPDFMGQKVHKRSKSEFYTGGRGGGGWKCPDFMGTNTNSGKSTVSYGGREGGRGDITPSLSFLP